MNVTLTIFLLYMPMLIFGICETWKEHKMWKKAMIEKWKEVKG